MKQLFKPENFNLIRSIADESGKISIELDNNYLNKELNTSCHCSPFPQKVTIEFDTKALWDSHKVLEDCPSLKHCAMPCDIFAEVEDDDIGTGDDSLVIGKVGIYAEFSDEWKGSHYSVPILAKLNELVEAVSGNCLCENRLLIDGEHDELKIDLFREVLFESSHPENNQLLFSKFLPVPGNLSEEEQKLWKIENWGCESEPHSDHIFEINESMLEVTFDTVGTPAIAFVNQLIKRFGAYTFQYDFFCKDKLYAGHIIHDVDMAIDSSKFKSMPAMDKDKEYIISQANEIFGYDLQMDDLEVEVEYQIVSQGCFTRSASVPSSIFKEGKTEIIEWIRNHVDLKNIVDVSELECLVELGEGDK